MQALQVAAALPRARLAALSSSDVVGREMHFHPSPCRRWGGGELINAWQRSAPRGGERGGVMGRGKGAALLLPASSIVLQGINP